MRGDSREQNEQPVWFHRLLALICSAWAHATRNKKTKRKTNLTWKLYSLAITHRSEVKTKPIAITKSFKWNYNVADVEAHREDALWRWEAKKREEHKTEHKANEPKYLVIATRYVRMVYLMFHVNAMRMDARREYKPEKQKCEPRKDIQRCYTRAWCCVIVRYTLVSSLCLRASEAASYEKRESKNDKKAEWTTKLLSCSSMWMGGGIVGVCECWMKRIATNANQN